MSAQDPNRMLRFGQPLGAIMQEAFIVPDIRKAAAHFTVSLGIGPFFYAPDFPLIEATYRGAPCTATVALAIGFSGNICYELIQQTNDAPSPWLETQKEKGYGYHHRAITTGNFDACMEHYAGLGYETILLTKVAFGTRAAYIDTRLDNYGMIEIIEVNDAVDNFFTFMRQEATQWDGTAPFRQLQ